MMLARQSEDLTRHQYLAAHLKNTAERTQAFAEKFAAGEMGFFIGFTHDIGKYSDDFQRRIRGGKQRVDHATPGGQTIYAQGGSKLDKIAAYCVMGHHAGLPNGGSKFDSPDEPTLRGRLKRKVADCSAYGGEVSLPPIGLSAWKRKGRLSGFSVAFLTRMLFSALVDADSLDAEAFEVGEIVRGGVDDVYLLEGRLNEYIKGFLKPPKAVRELDALRTELLKNCIAAAKKDSGLFTLTAPTGSGKTIASLSFALCHAALHKKDRVIYVIPYNTIIEQNAAVFENIVGYENVLQHHSNVHYDEREDTDAESGRKYLAVENWDYPVVVTSSVQFFQSLFGSRRSVCRKLHNIANSVIVFDEAQMIPISYLSPCVRAIRELVEHYGCTAVLATATQSALGSYFAPLSATEIVENTEAMYAKLRRASIEILPDPQSDDQLCERMVSSDQALCIVNTRKMAQSLYTNMRKRQSEGIFHLSTYMYPAHRSRVLAEIQDRLKHGLTCRVVSTSLVECGVDLDFPVVFREMAGLDSILQAAGRCNREGNRDADQSMVYVFTSADHKPPAMIGQNIEATKMVLRKYNDVTSLDAVRSYFEYLYGMKGEKALDVNRVVATLDTGIGSFDFPFREIAESFRLIEDHTQAVYVLHERPDLDERLRRGERSRALFRALTPYSLSLYRSHLRALRELGAVEAIDAEAALCLLTKAHYDERFGVAHIPVGGQAVLL